MIHIPIKQGSSEWLLQRYGIPTASGAHNIITPAKGEPTKGDRQDSYIAQLIAERHAMEKFKHIDEIPMRVEYIEQMLNRTKTEAMLYGSEMESKAANAYEFLFDKELQEAGFMMNDAKTAGASLDRLIKGEKRGVEFKCPFSLSVHIGYCLGNIEIDKRPQLQWQLWISGLEGQDICSYYPGFELHKKEVLRDEEYIQKIESYHAVFYKRLEERWEEWKNIEPSINPKVQEEKELRKLFPN